MGSDCKAAKHLRDKAAVLYICPFVNIITLKHREQNCVSTLKSTYWAVAQWFLLWRKNTNLRTGDKSVCLR